MDLSEKLKYPDYVGGEQGGARVARVPERQALLAAHTALVFMTDLRLKRDQ